VNTASADEMNVRSSMSQPIKIGSLYACDTAVPHGIAAHEVYTENGRWHQKWGGSRIRQSSITIMKCNVPLLVVDLPAEHSIDHELAISLYRGSTGGDSPWAACLYNETLVMLPQAFFEKPLSRYIDVFYTEVRYHRNADILSIPRI